MKSDTSLQTSADLEAEQAAVDVIRGAFPAHGLRTEERGALGDASSRFQWVIDGLDGTENFFLGIPYFSCSVAMHEAGQANVAVTYEPITDRLFYAVRDGGAFINEDPVGVSGQSDLQKSRVCAIPDYATKRTAPTRNLLDAVYGQCRRVLDTWAPSLDWCLVASGAVDAILAISAQPVRPSGAMLLLAEAGGRITAFDGKPVGPRGSTLLLATNGTSLHDALLKTIATSFR